MQYEVVVSKATKAFVLDIEDPNYSGSDELLEDKVNAMIAQGWKPLGGVSMTTTQQNDSSSKYSIVMFSQAMIKE